MRVGTVRSIHRYPVKSMGGEELERAEIGDDGLAGDRAFAVRDEKAGEIRGAKRLPKLMMLAARYRAEPMRAGITHASIAFPDGSASSTDDPEVSRRISAFLGREVTLHPRRPASDVKHYRRAQPGAALAGTLAKSDSLRRIVSRLATVGPGGGELRADFAREPGEPLPDFSVFPPELFEYVSPPGTYFDAYPIHLVTTATLDALRERNPSGDFDVRRFRPNLVVETGEEMRGFVEKRWEGRVLRVGGVTLECTVATPRCSMVIQEQPGMKKDPSVLRTVVKEADQCVGVYARVVGGGVIERGVAVEIE